jgi:predicted transcriptional regulator
MLNNYNDFISSSNNYVNKLKERYKKEIKVYNDKINKLINNNKSLNNEIIEIQKVISKLIKEKENLYNQLNLLNKKLNSVTKPVVVKIKVNGVCNPKYNNKNLPSLVL